MSNCKHVGRWRWVRTAAVLLLIFSLAAAHLYFPSKVAAPAAKAKVKISVKKKTMRIDKTYTMKASKSAGTVKWYSKNKKIVTINKKTGVAKPKKIGETYIVVKAANGTTDQCLVKVVPRVKVYKLTLAKTSASVANKKSLTLKYTVRAKSKKKKPNEKITWKSSNKKIVTVSSKGKVKAIAVGTARVYATAESGKRDSVKIRVYSLKAKISTLKLTTGMSKYVKSSFNYYGISTKTQLKFSVTNPKIAEVGQGGFVTGVAIGSTRVYAKAPDGSKSSFVVTVDKNPTIVDLSFWQGNIDWSKASSKIDFAILRTQFGADPSYETKYTTYSAACKKYKIPFGVYCFNLFNTKAEALKEAKVFYETATQGGRRPTVFFLDLEPYYKSGKLVNKITRTNVRHFITRLRELAKPVYGNRVKVGIYVAHHKYDEYNLDLERDTSDPATPDIVWIPSYASAKNEDGTRKNSVEPKYPCDIWQYTSSGKISGITGNVDMNSLVNKKGKKLSNKSWFTFEYLLKR